MKDFITHKQPNSKDCFVCGVENPYGLKLDFFKTGPGEVTVNTVVPEYYQGYPGIVHGGIVACLVDEVLGRTHMGDDQDNPRFMVTARIMVQYRQPVPTNKPIRIIGTAIKNRKRTATSKAAIFGPEGALLVEAEALLVNIPDERFKLDDLDAFGWRVYSNMEGDS